MTMKKIEADSEAESFVEEDWNDPEQVRCRSGQNQTYQYQRGQEVAIANEQA